MQDRVTMLPERLAEPLQIHLKQMKFQHEQDMAAGYGSTYLPYALARKYPNADKQWAWQYVFPSTRLSPDWTSPARADTFTLRGFDFLHSILLELRGAHVA